MGGKKADRGMCRAWASSYGVSSFMRPGNPLLRFFVL